MGGHWGLIEELGRSESVVKETAKASSIDFEDMEVSFNNDDEDENSFSMLRQLQRLVM